MDTRIYILLCIAWPFIALMLGLTAAVRFGWRGLLIASVVSSIVGAFFLANPVMNENRSELQLKGYLVAASVIFFFSLIVLTPIHLWRQRSSGVTVVQEFQLWGVLVLFILACLAFFIGRHYAATLKYSVTFVSDPRFPMLKTEYRLQTSGDIYRRQYPDNLVHPFSRALVEQVAYRDAPLSQVSVSWYSFMESQFYRASVSLTPKHFESIQTKHGASENEPAYHYTVVLYPKGHLYVLLRYSAKYSREPFTTIAHIVGEPFEGDLSKVKSREDSSPSSAQQFELRRMSVKKEVEAKLQQGTLTPISPEELIGNANAGSWGF